MDIILLGAPGAGKGTQAERLTAWLGVPQVSSGELFRDAIDRGTALGREAKAYLDRGELVPDAVTVAMVAERLAEPDCAGGVILDGFPRTLAQADALDGILAEMGRKVELVLYIEVRADTLLRRLAGRWVCMQCNAVYHREFQPERVRGVCDTCGGTLRQREDDTPEVQKRRIAVYLQQTAALIEHYRQTGLLCAVNGEAPIEAVQREMRAAVEATRERHG